MAHPNDPKLQHVILRSLIRKRSRFPKRTMIGDIHPLADDAHQLVQHVIGTPAQCAQAEERFAREIELMISAMNDKESRKDRSGNVIRPKYLEDVAWISTRACPYDGKRPLIIEEPNAYPA